MPLSMMGEILCISNLIPQCTYINFLFENISARPKHTTLRIVLKKKAFLPKTSVVRNFNSNKKVVGHNDHINGKFFLSYYKTLAMDFSIE